MDTTTIGLRAEQVAAEHLGREGFRVIARNWKRPTCEIDIVASRSSAVYFVEVKYRANDYAGSGLEYITSKKFSQMQYAARRWVAETRWHGQYYLSAIEVSGRNFAVSEFVESIVI